MPLSHQDQVNLLHDILTNHLEDCCGTVSEYEQLERLIQSLLENQAVPKEMEPLLYEIYSYSQAGKNSQNPDALITQHQQQLNEWVEEIKTF